MNDWILSIAGSPSGERFALYLALFAALAHACFGALQKGRHDPWLTRGAIDFWYGILAVPFALWVVPWPEPHLWPLFAGMIVIHVIYKSAQAFAYQNGAYTVVYPVVRGLGPLVTVIAAGFVFQETFGRLQWIGVILLSGAILALALLNYQSEKLDRHRLRVALFWAVLAGIMVAVYTTYDAYGIRATQSPMTFLVWFFLLDGLSLFPWIAVRRWVKMTDRPTLRPLLLRGLIGGLVAYLSFGAVMLATRLGQVGEAAAMRETSPLFAAIIGWLFLKEHVGPLRGALMGVIAVGAVLIEIGG